MRAKAGDRIIIHDGILGQFDRTCIVVSVYGVDGRPPYRVRWSGSGRETLFVPASDPERYDQLC